MIADLLRSGARLHGERTLLHGVRGSFSYTACRNQVDCLTSELRSCTGARLGLVGSPADWLLATLIALDELGARAYLIPPEGDLSQREALCSTLGLDAVLEERGALPRLPSARPRGSSGEIVLFSSGTAGPPKAALHTWASLASQLRVRPDLAGRRWLLGYGFASFAGIQVVLHTLANGGTLVIGEAGPEAARLAREQGVTHASGTPSFFRLLLSLAEPADLTALKLTQITLGGEAAEQGLLDALRRRFPAARLTQIYASTELGVCFSVRDGRAGFPAEWLDRNAHSTHLCVVDGELLIRSSAAMRGYLEGGEELRPPAPLFPTGDLVEVRGDRVVFLGRRGLTINVGGRKAFPMEIEATLLEVAGVRAVRVSALPSSLVGQLVRAEIVLEPAVDPERARGVVLAHCRERLSPHMVPRRLEFVSSLDHTPSRKLARR